MEERRGQQKGGKRGDSPVPEDGTPLRSSRGSGAGGGRPVGAGRSGLERRKKYSTWCQRGKEKVCLFFGGGDWRIKANARLYYFHIFHQVLITFRVTAK